jgi:anti-sigma B factor antagonist
MEISSTNFKHCSLVKVTGRIDSSTAPQLAETLDKLQLEGQYKIVLNLSGVDFISSSGLRVLINTLKSCRRYNRGDLILASVPERINAALDLAGFLPFFKVFEDDTVAVGQF